MKKFKGFNLVDKYPKDGWLKGYFYAKEVDHSDGNNSVEKAYQDLAYIRHKDYALQLLDIKVGERILDLGCSDDI